MSPGSKLPDDFPVRLNKRVRRYDGGRTLVGGSPTTAAYLSEPARSVVQRGAFTVRDDTSRVLADRLLELGMADPVLAELPPVESAAVTVVVPVHDRPQSLDELLGSIGSGVRVIVIDDCSSDAAAIADVAARHAATLIRQEVNRGPADARNTGLRHVRTPFVAFVDSDVVLEPDTLALLLRHFHDPKVALVGPRILGRSASGRTSWIARYENGRASLDLGHSPGIVRPRSVIAWLPAACLVGRVSDLGAGFTPGLRVAEDVDLVWRLAHQGRRVRFEPGAVARHNHRSTLQEWASRKLYYGTGASVLAERHGTDVAPAVISPWAAATAVALLLQRKWSLPLGAAISLLASERIARRLRDSDDRRRISIHLTLAGVGAALSQTSALMLRHWWPLALLAAVPSTRVRRALVIAAALDSAVEYRRLETDLDPVRFAAARRLDDLAYGAGVWLGAARKRSIACLLPDLRPHRTR